MSKKHKSAKKEQRQSLYTPQDDQVKEVEEKKEEVEVVSEEGQEVAEQEVVVEEQKEETQEESKETTKEEKKKDDKSSSKKDTSKDKKKDKKKKENKRGLVKRTKETASELKKVTWPSFAEVVKKTGIVIAFVVIFGLLIYGIDILLGWLVGLLV